MHSPSKPQYYDAVRFPRRVSGKELDLLLAGGWFRMYLSVFTTSHLIDWSVPTLRQVHWMRYEVDRLTHRRSHQRMRKNNKAFHFDCRPFEGPTPAEESLYSEYRNSCKVDTYAGIGKSLFGMSKRPSIFDTRAVRLWDGPRLVAMGLFDTGEESAASILHFYDPEYKRYSLGRYLMLLTVDWLKGHGYKYYYPGYIASGDPRFDYKLFLGSEHACCYDQPLNDWVPFSQEILHPHDYSEDDVSEFWRVTLRYDRVVGPSHFSSVLKFRTEAIRAVSQV